MAVVTGEEEEEVVSGCRGKGSGPVWEEMVVGVGIEVERASVM